MAEICTELGTLEVPEDGFVDYCLGIAREVYDQWGADPDEDEVAFDEFRYETVEPAVLSAMEDALDRALREFPREASAYADHDPRR